MFFDQASSLLHIVSMTSLASFDVLWCSLKLKTCQVINTFERTRQVLYAIRTPLHAKNNVCGMCRVPHVSFKLTVRITILSWRQRVTSLTKA
jgi:hypothetical protein